jgi:glycosyltransferase, family 1
MHAERPLVASRAQGLAEVVTDGVTGLLVEPDSPRALADALLSLAADPGRARTLARTARREAAKRFGVERYRTAMVEVVEDLLSEGAAS